MAVKKDHPYIWTTWLTRLLSGDSSCEWAAQFRAHHESKSYSKVSSGFDAARWQIEHTALLNKARAEMESTGANVYIEGQNFFTLRGKVNSSKKTLKMKKQYLSGDKMRGSDIDFNVIGTVCDKNKNSLLFKKKSMKKCVSRKELGVNKDDEYRTD